MFGVVVVKGMHSDYNALDSHYSLLTNRLLFNSFVGEGVMTIPPSASGRKLPDDIPQATGMIHPHRTTVTIADGAMHSEIKIARSPQEKLDWFNRFQKHFDLWVFKPIDRLVSSDDALVAFILMSCSIDYLASFWWGDDTKREVGIAYIGFVNNYFPENVYDSQELYKSLRNGLVHLFTIKGGTYALKHNRPDLHLQKAKNGQLILNSENFYQDLLIAKERYFTEVQSNDKLLDKAWQRYERDGFLDLLEI
jgi:hypothetical protein